MLRGELDLALITSAEALATQAPAQEAQGERYAVLVPARRQARRSRGSRRPTRSRSRTRCSRRGSRSRCSTTRAARTLGVGLDDYRAEHRRDARADDRRSRPRNPDAWFRVARIGRRDRRRPRPTTAWSATRTRSTWSSVMDVDMAGALVARDARARRRARRPARPARATCAAGATRRDPVLVAEHPDLAALAGDGAPRARRRCASRASASTTSRYLDLYSCFASSLHFARDALGIAADDPRGAHRHRRAAVSRRSGERLPHALDRGDGRAAARRSRARRAGERRRHAHDQARLRRLPRRRPARSRRPTPSGVQAAVDASGDARGRRRARRRRDRRARTRSCTAATARRSGRCSSATSPTARAPTRRCATPSCAPPPRRPSSSDATVRLDAAHRRRARPATAPRQPSRPGERATESSAAGPRRRPRQRPCD